MNIESLLLLADLAGISRRSLYVDTSGGLILVPNAEGVTYHQGLLAGKTLRPNSKIISSMTMELRTREDTRPEEGNNSNWLSKQYCFIVELT